MTLAQEAMEQQHLLVDKHLRMTPIAIAVYAAAIARRMEFDGPKRVPPLVAERYAVNAYEAAEVFDKERTRRHKEAQQ